MLDSMIELSLRATEFKQMRANIINQQTIINGNRHGTFQHNDSTNTTMPIAEEKSSLQPKEDEDDDNTWICTCQIL
jgi:hypothetical protein